MPRYASSRVLKPVKAFLRVEGIAWIVATILLGCTVAWSVLSIYSSVTAEGPHDSSWSNFASIASRWFVFNVAAMIFLALLEGPTWGVVGPKAPKFDLFPLFSWQVPAIQQSFFFWPCAFYILYALATGAPYYQFPAHGVASLFGQQLRELVLFNSDKMMVGHHVLTMFLSAYIWWGMQGFAPASDEALGAAAAAATTMRHHETLVALSGLSVAALEAGGLGVCLWTLTESGSAFYWVMSFSHALCLVAGWTAIYQAPSVVFFYVTFVLSCPLLWGRQSYMLKEVARGVPTGGFENHRFAEETAPDGAPASKPPTSKQAPHKRGTSKKAA